MQTIRNLTIAVVMLASAAPVFGHGFALSLNGNVLTATSNDFPGNGNPNLFLAELALSSGELRSTHGGAGTSLFGTGKSLSFDVYSPLLYSAGTGVPAEPAAAGISMLIESQNLLGSITVDGGDAFTAGYQILGNSSHEFRWTLDSTGILPEGVYGLAYRVKGGPAAGGAYDPTQLLVVTYMTPGFFPGNDPLAPDSPLSLATAAVYEAATNPVPEPSTWALMGFGVAGLLAVARRRTRRAPLASGC